MPSFAEGILVFPKGFEPPSSEPESDILSIELREQFSDLLRKNIKLFHILIIGISEKKKPFLQNKEYQIEMMS